MADLSSAIKSIRYNRTIRIGLVNEGLEDADIRQLAAAMESACRVATPDSLLVSPKLTSLNLKQNYIGDKGARALAKAVAHHPTLREINLYENVIGPKGMDALLKAIKANNSLVEINLCRNPALGTEEAMDNLAGKIHDMGKKNLLYVYPSCDRLEQLCEQNHEKALHLLRHIEGRINPSEGELMTDADRSEIKERLPSILHVAQHELHYSKPRLTAVAQWAKRIAGMDMMVPGYLEKKSPAKRIGRKSLLTLPDHSSESERGR